MSEENEEPEEENTEEEPSAEGIDEVASEMSSGGSDEEEQTEPADQGGIDDMLAGMEMAEGNSEPKAEEEVGQGGIDDMLAGMEMESDSPGKEDQGGIDDILASAQMETGSDNSELGQSSDSMSQDDISSILGQGDIDALLNSAEDEAQLIIAADGHAFDKPDKVRVEVCDFRNPVFLSETELRQIRIRHESYIHYLAAHLSIFLRKDVTLNMAKLHTLPYEKFIETIPSPTYINLFKIDPLQGVCVFNVNPRLALTLVNRMLGGKGHSITEDRYLTEIEMTIMDDIIQVIIDEWVALWSDMPHLGELIASSVGRENNGRFLQTAPRDAIMLVLDVETGIGDCSELFQMAFPYYFMEPIVKTLQKENRKYEKMETEEHKPQWYNAYSEIKVPVTAEWEPFEMSVSDLLTLKKGNVIEFPKECLSQTYVKVNKEIRYVGEAGVENGHTSVKINEKLEI